MRTASRRASAKRRRTLSLVRLSTPGPDESHVRLGPRDSFPEVVPTSAPAPVPVRRKWSARASPFFEHSCRPKKGSKEKKHH